MCTWLLSSHARIWFYRHNVLWTQKGNNIVLFLQFESVLLRLAYIKMIKKNVGDRHTFYTMLWCQFFYIQIIEFVVLWMKIYVWSMKNLNTALCFFYYYFDVFLSSFVCKICLLWKEVLVRNILKSALLQKIAICLFSFDCESAFNRWSIK